MRFRPVSIGSLALLWLPALSRADPPCSTAAPPWWRWLLVWSQLWCQDSAWLLEWSGMPLAQVSVAALLAREAALMPVLVAAVVAA